MRPNGRPADVRLANRGMEIHHGLNGNRRVEVVRADRSRIVVERGRGGYVQHPYMYRGREFARRTYYYRGHTYDHFYRSYAYRGVYVHVYAPAAYYRPAFYGWVYHPWVAPVVYTWGWANDPWYGQYGYYFRPYPVYISAPLWLTDYVVAASLSDAYQAQMDAAAAAQPASAPPPDAAPLTPQTKDLIAGEVQRQIEIEGSEAAGAAQNADPDPGSSGIERMLTDGAPHVFVAGNSLDVIDSAGAECAVSEGDALQLSAPPPPNSTAATVLVLSSKGGQECRAGNSVAVEAADLQEMQNHMRELIDQGLGELETNQGKGGLPIVPVSASGPPAEASFAAAAPPPDPNTAAELDLQAQAADQAEKAALNQVPQSAESRTASVQAANTPAAPVEISLGETIDQVIAANGSPARIVDLGAKKIYIYKDMKITFKDGKVSDVQ